MAKRCTILRYDALGPPCMTLGLKTIFPKVFMAKKMAVKCISLSHFSKFSWGAHPRVCTLLTNYITLILIGLHTILL